MTAPATCAGVIEHLDHLADLGVDAPVAQPVLRQRRGGRRVRRRRPPGGGPGDGHARPTSTSCWRRRTRAACASWATWSPTTPPSTTRGSRRPAAAGPATRRGRATTSRPGATAVRPSDWQSLFGGPAWEPFGDGEWYLHLFDVEQPDLNWEHPDVAADVERTVRFWLDRGFDGLRFDAAGALAKAPGYPPVSVPAPGSPTRRRPPVQRPARGAPVYRRFAQILAERPGPFRGRRGVGPGLVRRALLACRTSSSRRSPWTWCSPRSTPRRLGATVA